MESIWWLLLVFCLFGLAMGEVVNEIEFDAKKHGQVKRLAVIVASDGSLAVLLYPSPKDPSERAKLTKAELWELLMAHPELTRAAYKQLLPAIAKARRETAPTAPGDGPLPFDLGAPGDGPFPIDLDAPGDGPLDLALDVRQRHRH